MYENVFFWRSLFEIIIRNFPKGELPLCDIFPDFYSMILK